MGVCFLWNVLEVKVEIDKCTAPLRLDYQSRLAFHKENINKPTLDRKD